MEKCFISFQGFEPCRCLVYTDNNMGLPCNIGLRIKNREIYRLVYDVVLSRPEDYLSVYQSCCNHNCLKCHSWYFTQIARGSWYSPKQILEEVLAYSEQVTVWEPRSRATMWHASDLCSHCGLCKTTGKYGPFCPRKLSPDKIVLSPQGWGPARNIVSFTGGDLYCQPAFYIKAFKLIKREVPDMWIHIETNGYGLTPKNLELLYEAGLDSIWLDLKAFDEGTYRLLCGTTNKWILRIPEIVKDRGLDIVLEVVLLYIPGLVELDQMERFAEHLARIDKYIPITLLAFFPEYKLRHLNPPTLEDMVKAYNVMRRYGLVNVKVGNVGVVCRTRECVENLIERIGRRAVAL